MYCYPYIQIMRGIYTRCIIIFVKFRFDKQHLQIYTSIIFSINTLSFLIWWNFVYDITEKFWNRRIEKNNAVIFIE